MNKKNTRALASATVLSLVLTTAVTTANVKAAKGEATRIGGADRYVTAANVATSNWEKSDKVILASGEGYADSLSASVLSKKLDAPIILTQSKELNENAKAAIKKLGAKEVYVIGGNASVSEATRKELKDSGKKLVELGGKTRFETNLAIANYLADDLDVDASNVLVVNGKEGFSDALSVAPVAAAKGQILLIVSTDAKDAKLASDFVAKHKSKVTVVGTENVVPKSVYEMLKASERVDGGNNRFETNINILNHFNIKGDKLYAANATGAGYADALVGSALAGKFGAPLVLTDTKDSKDTAKAVKYIKEHATKDTDLQVLGGEGVMPKEVVDAINNAVKPAKPSKPETPVVKDLAVETVKAINPMELQVKFTAPVDAESALDVENYVFSLNGTKIDLANGKENVKFDAKENTVTFKLNAPLANGSKYSLDVKDGVKSKDLSKVIAKYEDSVKTFSDTKAPSLVTAEVTAAKKLKLTFDEPVSAAKVTVDGEKVKLGTPSHKLKDYTVETVDGELTEAMLKDGDHKVVVYDAKDTAKEVANVAGIQSASYTIGEDVEAPKVETITQATSQDQVLFGTGLGLDLDRTVKITFSEAVTSNMKNLTVKKGNHTFVLNGDKVKTYNNKSGKTVLFVEIPDGDKNPVFAKGENSAKLSVNVKGYKDASDLMGKQFNGDVSIKKDLSAPKVLSQYKNSLKETKDKEAKTLTVLFDKTLENVDGSKIVVKDAKGVSRAFKATVTGQEVLLTLNDSEKITVGQFKALAPFSVEFKAGAVKAEGNKKVNGEETTVVGKKHIGTDAVINDVADSHIKDNKIVITYKEKMDVASATKLANYTLDGKAIDGTVSINAENNVVTIQLKKGFSSKDIQKQLQISKDVKTATGSRIVKDVATKAPYTDMLEIKDTVNPTVKDNAKFMVTGNEKRTNKVKVTFSEPVDGFDKSDFKAVLEDSDIAVTGVSRYEADKSGKSYVLTLSDEVNLIQNLQLVAKDVMNIVDMSEAHNRLDKTTKVTIAANAKELNLDDIEVTKVAVAKLTTANEKVEALKLAIENENEAQKHLDAAKEAADRPASEMNGLQTLLEKAKQKVKEAKIVANEAINDVPNHPQTSVRLANLKTQYNDLIK